MSWLRHRPDAASISLMSLTADKIADLRVKHLEMLQAAITRMAANSTAAKNYSVTLVTAIVGFSISLKLYNAIWLGFLPVIVFVFLDAQYLTTERKFRIIFDDVRNKSWDVRTDFSFAITGISLTSILKAIWSWSVGPFYASLVIALGLAIIFIR